MSTAKRTSRIVWVAGLAVLLALLPVAASVTTFIHGPYAGAPSRDSVVISWVSSDPLPSRIEYESRSMYEETGAMSQEVSVPAFEPINRNITTHATLDELEPATDFVYRVILLGDESEAASPVGAFSTAPAAGEPVSFIVLADTQQQLEGINRLALVGDAIAADPFDFDFILHAGDVVESPISTYWDDWFSSFSRMLPRAPFIPVLGNHEKDHRSYYEVFNLPPGAGKNDEGWWALHWGDVVVVGLDSNATKANEFQEQQEWARTHLSGPEPHKFVIFHHPVFSSDAFHGTGYFFDKIYHPIFIELGVDIVFNGHSHHYEHIVRDGVTYLVVGGGGATPRQTTPDHIQGSDVSVEGHHFYVRVLTSPHRIGVEIVSVAEEMPGGKCSETDRLIDSFSLEGEPEAAEAPETPEERMKLPWGVLAAVVVAGATVITILLRRARR